MDIYEIEKQEGRYLAGELEKLRVKRSKGRVMVNCTPANSSKVNRFKNPFLMEQGLSDVFARATQFYITIDYRALSLIMVYDACQILYHLREEVDWKYVELEIIRNSRKLIPTTFAWCTSTSRKLRYTCWTFYLKPFIDLIHFLYRL